jgi:hypothetical protein
MSTSYFPRRALIVLGILLLLIALEEYAYNYLAKRGTHPHDAPHAGATATPSPSKPSVLSKMQSSLEKAMQPAAQRRAQDQKEASEQFGAALQKAGIETQAEPSH